MRVGQVLLTAEDTVRRGHYRNAQRSLERLLDLGVVPIVNENDAVATDKLRFGDNDRLAALVSHLVHADLMILLTDVDGLYDGPPTRPGAKRIREVRSPADIEHVEVTSSGSAVGTGGMITKLESVSIATASGIPVVLTLASNVAGALAGDEVGTFFAVTGKSSSRRRLWLQYAAKARGRLVLDDGAVRAVLGGTASLLPAGITAVEGSFESDDPVELVDPSGRVVARGLVSYDSTEIPELLAGRRASCATCWAKAMTAQWCTGTTSSSCAVAAVRPERQRHTRSGRAPARPAACDSSARGDYAGRMTQTADQTEQPATDVSDAVIAVAERAKVASRVLATATRAVKDTALHAMADALVAATDEIVAANAVDLERGRSAGTSPGLLDRLALTGERIIVIADALRALAALPDPVGEVVRGSTLPNGLRLRQVRVPMGVVGMIYEARPNVTVDAAGLALKSGNAVILRGGSAAASSNSVIVEILGRALDSQGLPADLVQSIDAYGRPGGVALMHARGLVDVLVPRGGADLIQTVVRESTVPSSRPGSATATSTSTRLQSSRPRSTSSSTPRPTASACATPQRRFSCITTWQRRCFPGFSQHSMLRG